MKFRLRRLFYIGLASAVGWVCFLLFTNFLPASHTNELDDQQKMHLNKERLHLRDFESKKDWHDYVTIESDRQRTGPGEQGRPVIDSKTHNDDAYRENGFNLKVSEQISLNRSLSDIRHPRCKTRKYLVDLPTASIVIPFHNEAWTTLFRTLHSIINRSPSELLHEIIIVDDFSSRDYLKEALHKEIAKYSKVKLFRLSRRQGLIRARLAGVDHATGEVIIILDSHIEVTHNWLPPLLEPIAMDRTTVTCPMIDVIHKDTFGYETQAGDAMRGAFDWELYYKRIPIPPEKQPDDPSSPFEDPVMAGGLFAIDRKYFDMIGRYDSGLEIWGGEQYELSFKVWMCGGRVLDAPCSRVGHIYRDFMPYSLPPGTNINKNFKRVIEVWMDEYKEYFYKKRPYVRKIDPGNLDKQKQLRKDLKCKSFKWFMTEVAPDIVKHYPPVLPEPAAWGKIYLSNSKLCLDARYQNQGKPLSVKECKRKGLADQEFLLTWKEDIRSGVDMDSARTVCIDGPGHDKAVILWECHGQGGNQLWKYQPDSSHLIHAHSGRCLTADRDHVILSSCIRGSEEQTWNWEHFNQKKLAEYNKALL